MVPLRPAMDVSIPQGDPLSQSDGNQQPTDLTQNRIFMRVQGTQSATVGGGGGRWGRGMGQEGGGRGMGRRGVPCTL